jgi:peroxiredoxin
MFRGMLMLVVALVIAGPARGGEFNKKLNIGDAAPAWENLPGTDDKTHSLADLKGKDVVVVVFTCNSCPVAVGYEDRIIALAQKYAGKEGKVAVVAINVNVIEEDRLPKMRERAKEKGFTFPYLFDETQKIARAYGALYTPEFFVLNKDRKVVFMGAMDNKNKAEDAKINYLEPAVEAALKGDKPQTAETQGRGCLIRYLREKK